MKFKPEKKYVQIGLTVFFTAIAIMLVYLLFFRLKDIKEGIAAINKILAPIIYGLILAYLMTPLLNAIEKKWLYPVFDKHEWWKNDKKRDSHIRALAVSLTIIFVLFFIYLFFASVIPQLYSSIQSIINQYSTYTQNLINWLEKITDKNPGLAKFLSKLVVSYSDEADDFLNDMALPAIQNLLLPNVNEMLSSLTSSIMKVIKFLWNIIIGLIISIYVLSSKEKFSEGSVRLCYATFETKSANKLIEGVRFTHHTFIGFLSGKVVDSAIIGILCYICCLFMRMPYPLLVSVIVGVTNIVPFFGPFIGAIPTTIIILLVDPKKAITFVIFILILQQFDGNILGPMILSQSTGLTSFWIIFAITLFGGLWGFVGMILGVPVAAVIASFIEKTTQERLKRKNLPTDADKYLDIGAITEEGEFTHYEYKKPEHKKIDPNKKVIKLLKAIWNLIKKAGILLFELLKMLGVSIYKKFREIKEQKKNKK